MPEISDEEQLKTENEQIFSRISQLITPENPEQTRRSFKHPGTQTFLVKLELYKEPEGFMGYGSHITQLVTSSLPFPVAEFNETPPGDVLASRTSPYGVHTGIVIGSDGKLYTLQNRYLFDSQRKAKKLERVLYISDSRLSGAEEDIAKIYNLNDAKEVLKRIDRLDFIPNEDDSRLVELTDGDYEKIQGILHQIEQGEWAT